MVETEKKVMARKLGRLVRAVWIFNWFNSCGCTELLPVVSSRYDMERFGLIIVDNPKHADCLIITGYQTIKSIKRVVRIYNQMPDPKVVMALGSCPITGGMYWDSYNTIKRLSDYIPVHMYVPGCPPRPEAVFQAVGLLVEHVRKLKEEVSRK